MTGRERLEARIRDARRLERLQEAEVCGLIRASYSPVPFVYSNTDPEMQARWALGFREGIELLALDVPLPAMEDARHG